MARSGIRCSGTSLARMLITLRIARGSLRWLTPPIADALITSWNNKNFYVFWRPITAIQEGSNDGNPWTAGDPNLAAADHDPELSGLHLGSK